MTTVPAGLCEPARWGDVRADGETPGAPQTAELGRRVEVRLRTGAPGPAGGAASGSEEGEGEPGAEQESGQQGGLPHRDAAREGGDHQGQSEGERSTVTHIHTTKTSNNQTNK